MDKYNVAIGKMNKRVTIQRYVETTGEWDNATTDWKDLTTVWASINSLFGREFWVAKQANLENTVNITIRYQKVFKNLDAREYRIKWDNKFYNIIHIDNPNFENRYLILKCIELV